MSDHFDPFGEPMAKSAITLSSNDAHGEGSSVVRYTGTAIFWGLVVSIITARVLFFDPSFEHAFTNVKTFVTSLGSVIF